MSYTLNYRGAKIDELLGQVDEQFIAEYNVALYADITAAIAAGKQVLLKKDNALYPYIGQDATSAYTFAMMDEDAILKLFTVSTASVWATVSKALQEELTFDAAPTDGSTNPVTSDGIYDAIEEAKAEAQEQSYDLLVTDTAQGSIATFPDGADDVPVKSLIAQITPLQSGTGDPAPDNIRPISGWTGANIHVADGENPHVIDNVYPIDWTDEAGTVYGGTLNVTTGVLTDEFSQKATFTGIENWQFDSQYQSRYSAFYVDRHNLARIDDYRGSIIASNMMTIQRAGTIFTGQVNTIAITGYQNNPSALTNYLYIIVDNQAAGYEGITTADALKTWLGNNNVEVTFKVQTPQTYQLTPTEVKTLLGNNNIFTDCSSEADAVNVVYRCDTALYIDKKLGQ